MIVRFWRGWTSPELADAYEKLLRETIFPGIAARRIPGYLGIRLLRRSVGAEVEFATEMSFEDRAAVELFAGPDHERAVVPAQARALLSRFDEVSAHYELIADLTHPLRA